MRLFIQRVLQAEVTVEGNTVGKIGKGLLVFVGAGKEDNREIADRPSFIEAGAPDMAEELYEYMIQEAQKTVPVVEHGVFGADMKVALVNDGPFTILLDEHIL